jgi:hypothetical protein
MLNNLIKVLENSPEVRYAWDDLTDAILVEKLKETYLNTLSGGLSSHPEDIAENKKISKAIAVVLGYFMYVKDAEEFLKEANKDAS